MLVLLSVIAMSCSETQVVDNQAKHKHERVLAYEDKFNGFDSRECVRASYSYRGKYCKLLFSHKNENVARVTKYAYAYRRYNTTAKKENEHCIAIRCLFQTDSWRLFNVTQDFLPGRGGGEFFSDYEVLYTEISDATGEKFIYTLNKKEYDEYMLAHPKTFIMDY